MLRPLDVTFAHSKSCFVFRISVAWLLGHYYRPTRPTKKREGKPEIYKGDEAWENEADVGICCIWVVAKHIQGVYPKRTMVILRRSGTLGILHLGVQIDELHSFKQKFF